MAAPAPSPDTASLSLEEQARLHGLSGEEYAKILTILGRKPNEVELGIFSVMWSEHCSYKTTRKWLKTLPTEGPQVICGPGENAGVVDIGDGQAVIFKMESHNHPSYIEPYQGAATGVGGILRDVFTMGARPIANINALRFGDPAHPKTRRLVAGVVAGIGGYGNCIGVPTVGGECEFDPAYNGNILVNAMTVGLADADKIFYSAAAGIGNPVVYVGAKTGRDGIHGATMASASFDEDSEEKRPTVQVGDPFTEKRLLEACLELMATDAIIAIQDMGAAGLTSSSIEMASKGGVGITLEMDRVPCREEGMTPYEMMLSESQERMLMILRPEKEAEARAIFDKWELDFAVIGQLTDSGRLMLRWRGEIVCDIPVDPLGEEAPVYDRPWTPTEPTPAPDPSAVPALAPAEALAQLLGSANGCSRRWIWEQYDYGVMADTLDGPGGDAAVVRVHGTHKALAIASDCTPRYVFADPVEGGKQAVAESWRNLSAVGATPLAVTNNLNFGNPERPVIMGQLVGAIQGMGEACRVLDFPVISGNVSLYNETRDGETPADAPEIAGNILPTPVIGGVGLLEDATRRVGLAFRQAGEVIFLLGDTKGHLGQSRYLKELCPQTDDPAAAPPPVDLEAEKRHGAWIRARIAEGALTACHDVSGGGLLVALAEMALAGDLGAKAAQPQEISALPATAFWFGEDQARYLFTATPEQAEKIAQSAAREKLPLFRLGEVTTEPTLTIGEESPIPLAPLRTAHENWLPRYMRG